MTKPPDKMPLVLGLVISRPILYLVKVNSCHPSITYSTYTISIHHSVYPAFLPRQRNAKRGDPAGNSNHGLPSGHQLRTVAWRSGLWGPWGPVCDAPMSRIQGSERIGGGRDRSLVAKL